MPGSSPPRRLDFRIANFGVPAILGYIGHYYVVVAPPSVVITRILNYASCLVVTKMGSAMGAHHFDRIGHGELRVDRKPSGAFGALDPSNIPGLLPRRDI
jgi:hypothetical protein